jgi:hypothetical protein
MPYVNITNLSFLISDIYLPEIDAQLSVVVEKGCALAPFFLKRT